MADDLTQLLQHYQPTLSSRSHTLYLSRKAKLTVMVRKLGRWVSLFIAPLSFASGIIVTLISLLSFPLLSTKLIVASTNAPDMVVARNASTSDNKASVQMVAWNDKSPEEPNVLEVSVPTDTYVSDAKVKVTLDDNVALENYPMVKKLSFQAELDPENPVIALPVIKTGNQDPSQESNVIVEVETPDTSRVVLYKLQNRATTVAGRVRSGGNRGTGGFGTFNASFISE